MGNQPPCTVWAEKLALRHEDLSPADRAALEAHVRTCPACEATQADYRFLDARLVALPSLRDPSRFAGWIYRIATNCAYNYQHRARHLDIVPWDAYRGRDAELSIAGPEEQVEETELLKLALARVSPTYRPCLILYVIEELPQRKIADLLKIKESSVGKYVSRGKEELRQIYHRLVKEQNAVTRGGR